MDSQIGKILRKRKGLHNWSHVVLNRMNVEESLIRDFDSETYGLELRVNIRKGEPS